MAKSHWIVFLAALSICSPSIASDKAKKKSKAKVETGASCKAPAVGACAACSISCRPGETAVCAPGQTMGDACHLQPSCKCTR